MPRPAAFLVLAVVALAGCQYHQHEPYSQEYPVPPDYSVEYEYVPPEHPEFHEYHDHDGHRYHEDGLNASHGGYGSYGVLLDD